MFSGLIREKGNILSLNRDRLEVLVQPNRLLLGESVAINGVCLTAIKIKKLGNKKLVLFDLSAETLKKTTLGLLSRNAQVNVEYPLTLEDGLGGHLVQGHVDGMGWLRKIVPQKMGGTFWFGAPQRILSYLVPKGSVAVDGVSLTVVEINKRGFSVVLIPTTLRKTNLGGLKKGMKVNLEVDILAKYVRRCIKGCSL